MRIRDLEYADYPRWTAIWNESWPNQGYSPEVLQAEDDTIRTSAGDELVLLVAELDGLVVGGAQIISRASRPPGHPWLYLVVDKAWRGRGVGSALLERAEEEASSRHAKVITANVPGGDADSLAWIERRGYREWRRRSCVEILLSDLEDDIDTVHRQRRARLEERGLRLATMAEADSATVRRSLYDLDRSGLDDVPSSETGGDFDAFGDWERATLRAPSFRADSMWLALQGDRVVGYTAFEFGGLEGEASVGFTAVARDFRGQGLARALKAESVLCARDRGLRRIVTHFDDDNPGIEACNRDLGFRPVPGSVLTRKTLLPASA